MAIKMMTSNNRICPRPLPLPGQPQRGISPKPPPRHRHGVFIGFALLSAIGLGCQAGPRNFVNDNDQLRRQVLQLNQKNDQLGQTVDTQLAQIDTLSQRLGDKPAIAGMTGVDLPHVSSVRFDRFSTLIDTDGDTVPDTVRLYIQTLDQRDRFLPAVGQARFQVLVITPPAPPQVLANQVVEPSEFDSAYRTGPTGTHFTITIPLASELPQSINEITVKMRFTDAATGAIITHQQVLTAKAKK